MGAHRALAIGAVDAAGHAGVKLQPARCDFFSAVFAIAEFAFVHPGEGGFEFLSFHLSARMGCLGHGLILQSVLTAKPSHGLLVQFYRRLTRLPEGVLGVESLEALRYVFAKICLPICIQFLDPLDHSFAFCETRLSDILNHKHRSMQMVETRRKLAELDPVWARIRFEAEDAIEHEPLLGGVVHSSILHHSSFESALAYRISLKLGSGEMPEMLLREICDAAYEDDADISVAGRADIVAVNDRDPACDRFIQPLLFFKGFQAIQAYRVANWLWRQDRRDMARFFQMRISEVFGVDIHPAARIGKGIMIDHAHSIVIGETATVGDNVSMLHSVTLGGTGKEEEDRHPKIGDGVLIGAGAKVLGNIRVGNCSRVAAGSVVLQEVPPCKTVAGVPAKIVGEAGCDQPSVSMDQLLGIKGSE